MAPGGQLRVRPFGDGSAERAGSAASGSWPGSMSTGLIFPSHPPPRDQPEAVSPRVAGVPRQRRCRWRNAPCSCFPLPRGTCSRLTPSRGMISLPDIAVGRTEMLNQSAGASVSIALISASATSRSSTRASPLYFQTFERLRNRDTWIRTVSPGRTGFRKRALSMVMK